MDILFQTQGDFKKNCLNYIDDNLVKTKNILMDITNDGKECLQELSRSIEFVLWVKEALEGTVNSIFLLPSTIDKRLYWLKELFNCRYQWAESFCRPGIHLCRREWPGSGSSGLFSWYCPWFLIHLVWIEAGLWFCGLQWVTVKIVEST